MNRVLGAPEPQEQNKFRGAWIIYSVLAAAIWAVNIGNLLISGISSPIMITALGSLVILVLVWFRWLEWAGILLFLIMVRGILALGLEMASILLPGTLILTAVSTVIVISTFRPELHRYAFIIIGATSILLIFTDLYWPAGRAMPPEGLRWLLTGFGLVAGVILVYGLIRDFPSFSLGYKFIFTIALFSIVGIAATTYFVSRATAEILLEEAGQEFQAAAAFNASVIRDTMERDLELLQILGGEAPVYSDVKGNDRVYAAESRDSSLAEIEEIQRVWSNPQTEADKLFVAKQRLRAMHSPAADELNRFIGTILPGSDQLVVVDQLGKIVAASSIPQHYYYGDEAWFQAVSAAGELPFISDVFVRREPSSPRLAILYAVPIIDKSTGEFLGALAATNDLSAIRGLFETVNTLGSNVIMGIIIDENREFTIENGELTFKNIELEDDLQAELQSNGFGLGDFLGVSNLLSFVEIGSDSGLEAVDKLEWAVIIHQEERIALAAVANQQRTQILIGLIIVAIGVLGAIIIAQFVVGPLRALREAAGKIAQGDYGIRAPVNTGDEIAAVAVAFNDMATVVQDSVQNLENRIHERTQALNASYRISRSLANLIRQDELIKTVVEELKDLFGYDHVHIYLLDDQTHTLRLVRGSGEAAQQLIEQQHALAFGNGLVGLSAESRASILSSDVTVDPRWNPHPLLPETLSELVIPIVIGDRLLGVIDIQVGRKGGLKEQDQELVEAIAGQLAIGLRNAEYVQEAENQARREATINQIRQRILETRNVNDAIKIAARELAQATERQVAIHLGDTSGRQDNVS